MFKTKCKTCGKEVEGYSKNHADFLMLQHSLKHRREDKKKKDGDNKNNEKG